MEVVGNKCKIVTLIHLESRRWAEKSQNCLRVIFQKANKERGNQYCQTILFELNSPTNNNIEAQALLGVTSVLAGRVQSKPWNSFSQESQPSAMHKRHSQSFRLKGTVNGWLLPGHCAGWPVVIGDAIP